MHGNFILCLETLLVCGHVIIISSSSFMKNGNNRSTMKHMNDNVEDFILMKH